MSRTTGLIDKLSENLVAHITGFKKRDENFALCMQYASSNLRYHKFLEPNSNQIERSIKGLQEKLKIHCQDGKADILSELTDKFLALPVFELGENGKTTTHWAVLSLLLQLSNSPLYSNYEPRTKKVDKNEDDDFDWYAYLTEGEEPYIPPLSSSDDDSDFDAELDDVNSPRVSECEETPRTTTQNITLVDSSHPRNEDWLKRNVVVEYWREGQRLDPSQHESSSFNLHWEESLSRGIDSYASGDCVHMTEYQVVREALWLLYGANESFLFVAGERGWSVRSNVQLTHITQMALRNALKPIVRYSNIIRRTQKFLNSTEIQVDQRISQTYQAFRGALAEFHTEFQQYLAQVEKSIMKQDNVVTISSLLEAVLPRLRDFDVIEHVLREGVDVCRDETDNAVKACRLLACIYHLLTTSHVLDDQAVQFSLVLPLWVKSCRPYLEMIDKWLYNGLLYDPFQEFIISINENISEEDYWDKGFRLHCSAPRSGSDAHMDKSEHALFAPVFLLPVLHEIIMAGKSMHMLEKLGKIHEVNPGSSRQSLYDAFVTSIENYLGQKDVLKQPTMPNATMNKTSLPVLAHDSMSQLSVRDSLLQLNFDRLLTQSATADNAAESHKSVFFTSASQEHDIKPLGPIETMLRHCLYAHITQRYDTVCGHLLHVMKMDYQLLSYFHAIKRYYLMEAGDTMHHFCSDLFEKLRHREEWKDVSSLNAMMQEWLHDRFPQDEDRLFVDVETQEAESRGSRLPIRALQPLTLHYKIPWPINVIIGSKSVAIYNTVFRFLLMVKRAKYSLDILRFSELETAGRYDANRAGATAVGDESPSETSFNSSFCEPSRQQLTHDMHMLRFKLLCFANSFENYIMTRIIHSTTEQFERDLDAAQNIDDVIRIHNDFLLTLHARCLQHKDIRFLREIVVKVFNLAVLFCQLWGEGIDNIKFVQIRNLEVDYCRCVQFISTFFNKVIRRGSFQHLEPLAFALRSAYNEKILSVYYKNTESVPNSARSTVSSASRIDRSTVNRAANIARSTANSAPKTA